MTNQAENSTAPLSSLSMIRATVMNDMNSRYWALGFVCKSHQAKTLWLRTVHFTGLLLKGSVVLLFLDMVVRGNVSPIKVFILAIGLGLAVGIEIHERLLVRNAAAALIQKEFSSEQLKEKTFYQVAEHLSQACRSPSLIALIVWTNTWGQRAIILCGFVTLVFIPLDIPLWVLLVIAGFLVAVMKTLSAEIFISARLKN